jgi:hypothetical protein
MKVLLRNRDTGLFLKGKTLWTYYATEARDFVSCLNAMEHTLGMRLTNAELILSFGDPRLDIRISPRHMRLLQPTRPTWA